MSETAADAPATHPPNAPQSPAERRPSTPRPHAEHVAKPARTRRRLLPPGVDGRLRGPKRLAELARELAARVSSPDSPVAQAAVLTAAGLLLQSEQLAQGAAAGDAAAGVELGRVQNAVDSALRRLETFK